MGGRRLRGEGSIYKRASDGRWFGVVDLGWANGKRIRKSVSAPTLKELKPKYDRLQALVKTGVLPDDLTVEQWMNYWLDSIAAKKLRPSTLITYRGYVEKWVIPAIGRRRLDKLRPEHIRAVLEALEQAGRSDATRRQVFAIMHRSLAVAFREQRIPNNPANYVDPPHVGQGTHGRLSLEDAHRVLATLDEEGVDGARWVVALLGGLRQGEALGLTWDHIDLDVGVIRVRQAAQRIRNKGIVIGPPKSKASVRDVPMVMPVREALRALPRRSGYVFGDEKPKDPRRDWQEWKDLLKLAGVEHKPLHAARVTCGSLLAEAGVPATVIRDILGQSQVSVTMRHYTKGEDRQYREAMDALDGLLGPGSLSLPTARDST